MIVSVVAITAGGGMISLRFAIEDLETRLDDLRSGAVGLPVAAGLVCGGTDVFLDDLVEPDSPSTVASGLSPSFLSVLSPSSSSSGTSCNPADAAVPSRS